MKKETLKQIVGMQDKLNILSAGKDWKNKEELKWELAIRMEATEFIDSFNWKWWKKSEPDYDNAKVELVDIFHFVLSLDIKTHTTPRLMKIDIDNKLNNKKPSQKEIIEKAEEFFVYSRKDADAMYGIVFELWNMLGMNIEDMFKSYLTKNVLNVFRQEHGYADGTYMKSWSGEEDNVVCFRIASSLELNEEFAEMLGKGLEGAYSEN